MRWQPWICDTMTGLVDVPVDIPHFQWSVTVSSSSFTSTSSKDVEIDEVQSLTVPWTAIPATDPAARNSMLAPSRRSIMLAADLGDGTVGIPLLMGAIGDGRADTALDTSFTVDSPLEQLDQRKLVREGVYGAGVGGTSPDTIGFTGMSLRGIASEVGRLCTDAKPAGVLPIDWTYLGEAGSHDRTYQAFDVQNISGRQILAKIAANGGPDLQFRPYLADPQHVRFRFLGGSDSDIYLGQNTVHQLTWWPAGGTLQDLHAAHAAPYMRFYGSGAGSDAAQVTALAEDLALCHMQDPWPIREAVYADTDQENIDLLRRDTSAQLTANSRPLIQFSATVDFSDPSMPSPGSFWPGEVCELVIEGFPSLPDDIYPARLMVMSGDETTKVSVKFDLIDNPLF